jgi:peptidoglycan/LPS O-acetylase OafA/YrhL
VWILVREVYWADVGRDWFVALIVAAVLGGLMVLGVSHFYLPHDGGSVAAVAVAVLLAVLLSSLAILKGKLLTGLLGIFIPLIALVGVARLAAPDSWWARRWYDPAGRKMTRAEERWERIKARRRRVSDAIAGAPGIPTD